MMLFTPELAQAGDRTTRTAPSPRQRALELFEQSAKAYRDGRFQDAIDLLVEARRIKPEPVLLYNIGRAYEALGNPTQAADAYAAYLAEDPKAPDRKAIEIRITTLRAQADELDKARTMPPPAEAKPLPPEPPPPAPPAPPPDTSVGVVPWVVTGAGIVGVGAGVVLGLVAESRHRAAVDEPGQAVARHKQDQAETFATGATIAFVAGAAVTAVGVGWLTVRVLTPAGVNVVAGQIAGPLSLGVRGAF
jgi:tetratricopeptide (TPR) repeat protein